MSVDLNFTAPTNEPAETPLIFDNRVCEGGYKLLQRIIILLFKDTGTSSLPDLLGTDILQLVTGNVVAEDELQNQFTIAGDQVREAIQNFTDEDAPEDEQLDNLVIDVTLSDADRSYVLLNITVETVSGDAYNSTVPYKLTGDN